MIRRPPTMSSGLQRRLTVLLISPLILLGLVNAWFDYSSADSVAQRQDQSLLALLPLLADSVVAEETSPGTGPVMLMAPAVEGFIKAKPEFSAFSIVDSDGRAVRGDAWLAGLPPTNNEPEFHSEERQGVTWRIVRQRVKSVVGDITVVLADGSDPRQQWARAVLLKVVLPNFILIAFAVFAVRWAVGLALRPLLELRDAVEHRSPRDLSAIDLAASPEEVRPLVQSLNHLFGLVNAQADGQRRFVADAAHQLRTPLAGLQAQVEAWAQAANAAVAGGAAPSGQEGVVMLRAEQINKLRNAARRTSQLANQLLALSRADARAMHSQPMQRVDLKQMCEVILESHLDAATAKQIDLGLEGEPAFVMGHEWLLRELLGNVVSNAVNYTPAKGTVTIRFGMRGTVPFLEVEDDGPGIAPSERARALERFYRLRGTQGEGSGLGLAIADEIARAHHSHLVLSAGANGCGLKVSLALPQDER